MAPWNEGAWRLEIDAHGQGRLLRDPEPGSDAIELDIGALTAALIGYQRPRALARAGRLVASEEQLAGLEARLPLATPYLADFF